MRSSGLSPALPLDIEFPLKTRGDARLPFLARRLLHVPGPLGLEVEIKSEARVVGTWSIEFRLRGAGDRPPAQARAHLYVCASARGDPRATGAFLVVRQWRVQASERERLEQLYVELSIAVLERLDSLMGGVPAGESPVCILFLVDGTRTDSKLLSLDRLQIRILEDLECEHAIAGLDLRVAHGRGTGTQPHVAFLSTVPPSSGNSDFAPGDGATMGTRSMRRAPTGEVFVPETLSPTNVKWSRRASDRLHLAIATESLAAGSADRKRPAGDGPVELRKPILTT